MVDVSSTVTDINQQGELFFIRWTFAALRDFLTAALDCRSKSWDHWRDRWSSCQLMWNIPAKFPIHLFTAVVQNSTEGFSVGLWEVRPKQHKQPGGTILKCWEFFSSQLEDSVVINLLLVIETVACSECLHLYQGFFAACVGERICSLFFLLSVERWCCSYNDPLGGTSVEKGTPRC